MPKELHEIRNFMTGTVTTPSETDIPDDAASYSLNIDPVAEDGILKGIPNDLLAIIKNASITCKATGDVANGFVGITVDNISGSFTDPGGSSTAYLYVEDDTGEAMILGYTDLESGGTEFTGLTWLGPGSGNIDNNDDIFQVPSIVAHKMAMINDDGAHRVVYFDDTDNEIKKIDDIHGTVGTTAAITGATESATGLPTMQVNNKEVHIGMGKGAGDKPLWCGMIPHGQFGGAAPSGLQLEDSELISPSSFTNLTKVFCNDAETKIYGYLIDTPILYRFDIAASTMDMRSATGLFTYAGAERNIHSACKVDGEDMMWVVTAGDSNQVIHKVDMDNFAILFSCQTNLVNSTKAVDVIHINADNGDQDFIWFSTGSSIRRFVTPSVGDTPVPANVTPKKVFETNGAAYTHESDAGTFIYYTSGAWTGASVIFDFKAGAGENSLFKPSNITSSTSHAWVGWAVQIKRSVPTTSNGDVYFIHADGCIHAANSDCSHRIKVIDSANTYGLIAGLIMRDDATDAAPLSSDSDVLMDNYITAGTVGGLVTIDTTQDHNVLGMSGTNDDVFVISIDNSTKSNLKSTTVPNGAAVANGQAIALNAGASDSLDLNNACGVCIKDNSTEKFHLFSGTTDARWAYGTFAAPAAKLEGEIAITLASVSSGGTLVSGTEYKYKASFVYDGYQESPLTPGVLASLTPGGSNYSHTVTTTLRNVGNFRKRVTRLNIYVSAGTGFYRLLKSLDITNSWEVTADTSSKPAWGNYYKNVMTDDGSYLASYEASNGISEVVRDTLPYYSLSAQLNNQHFISDCSHPNFEDANLIIFKSKPYNFDQFDWSVDLLRLPSKPTALSTFNGRIYAFDENNTYRIEPNSFYIEDTFEGVGCIGPEAVVVTEYGMCFADKNNIYLHNGSQPTPIGDPILRGDNKSWQNRDTSWASKIVFDAERNSFVVMFKYSSNYYAWTFNIARTRWDLWEIFGTTEPLGTLAGKNGEMFVSNGTHLMHYLGGTGNDNWDWYSKKLTMDQSTQTKIFKKTRVAGNATDCIDTFVSSEGTPTDSSATDGVLDRVYTLSGTPSRAKWLQYKITAESNTVDAIGTVFRRRSTR
jgi:hypothetical protein